MKLNDLKPAPHSKQRRRRKGRGLGSGRGKTAGRGQKGQKSRSGFSQGRGWEGGKSRLIMRLPKRGFTRVGEDAQIVNVGDLNAFEAGSTIDAQVLADRGLVRSGERPVKLLGDGELEVRDLTIDVAAWSSSAVRAVTALGGTVVGAEEAEKEKAASEAAAAAESAAASTDTDAGAEASEDEEHASGEQG